MDKQTGVKVKLLGTDGNIFSIIAKVRLAMRREKIKQSVIEEFTGAVQASGSYDEALCVIMEYVDVK